MTSSALSTFRTTLFAIALASQAPAAALVDDGPPPSAEQILDRMEQACGDVEKRSSLKSLRMAGSIQAHGSPGDLTFTEVFLGRERFKQTMRMGKDFTFTMGSTGEQSWSTDPAMGITVRDGDAQLGTTRWFAFGRRAPWRTLYESAELLGVADVDGDDCWKLRMVPQSGSDAHWYVDQESHLPRKMDVKVPDPAGGDDVAMSWTFDHWQNVDGIAFPHTKTMLIMGVGMTYRYTSIEPNAVVTEEEIAPSDEVKQALLHPKPAVIPGEVTIETLQAQPILSIRATVKATELSMELARLLPEIGSIAMKSPADMAGPPFTRYHTHGGDEMEIEAGIPVKTKLAGAGRVTASTLPAGRVATMWHVGPYSGLTNAHLTLEAWIKEHGHEVAGGPWEIYWTDPGMEPDPSKWRTQLCWPIK